MSKFYKAIEAYKKSQLELAVCDITGIAISLSIPTIPNKVLSYQNPFSIPANAIGIAKLSYTEKTKIEKQVLSGCILTLLNHYQLVKDHFSSVQRNALLSECSPYILHSFLSLFIQNSREKIRMFPSISFESITEYTQESILSYIEACQGKGVETQTLTSSVSTTKKIKIVKSVSSELRQTIKSLIERIAEENIFPAKIIAILSLISQKNNLYSLNPSIRNKLVEKLSSSSSENSIELSKIIKDAAFSEGEDITQHFSENKPVKSLKDILAAKLGKTEQKQEEKQEQVEKAEDLFFPSFSHSDCENCEYEMTSCKELGYCYILESRKEESLSETLGLIKEIADDMGLENNLEYVEEDQEEEDDSSDNDTVQDEEGEDDEF